MFARMHAGMCVCARVHVHITRLFVTFLKSQNGLLQTSLKKKMSPMVPSKNDYIISMCTETEGYHPAFNKH